MHTLTPIGLFVLLAALVGCVDFDDVPAWDPVGPAAAPREVGNAATEVDSEPLGMRFPARPVEPWTPGRDARPEWAFIDAHAVSDMAKRGDLVALATDGGVLFYREQQLIDRLTTFDGLISHAVRALHWDDQGRLWMAFAEGGCQRFDGRALDDCAAGDTERLIALLDDGRGVLGLTWEGGFVRIDGAAADAPAPLPPTVRRARHAVRCAGTLWVGTRGSGLWRWDRSNAWRSLDQLRIVDALACHAGSLVAGGPEGFFQGDSTDFVRLDLPGTRRHVTMLASGPTGLWAGLADGTLVEVGQGPLRSTTIGAAAVRGVVVGDRLWLAAGERLVVVEDAGLDVVDERPLPGPGSGDIASVATRGDRLALGLFRDGVALWAEGGWQRVGTDDGLPSDEVNHLTFDASGRLWVATSNGLAWLDLSGAVGGRFTPPLVACGHINGLLASPESGADVLAATSCGIGWFRADATEPHAWETTEQGLPHRHVYTLTSWNGHLVAGTNDGLAIRDGADPDRPWTRYRAARTALTDNWITAVAALDDGRLAVGTYSGGLYLGPAPDALEPVQPARYVNPNALLATSDGLWVGGLSEGAYQVGSDTVRELGVGRCLPGDDVTGFAEWRGRLVVTTRTGAVALSDRCAR